MTPTPTAISAPRFLYQSIFAVILAFIPVLCAGGVILGIATLQKVIETKDTIAKVLSIIAIVVGALVTLQTVFVLFIFFSNVAKAPPTF